MIIVSIDGIINNINGSMLLYFNKSTLFNNYLPGDRIIIKCTPIEIINRGNPFEFNYKSYMENVEQDIILLSAVKT